MMGGTNRIYVNYQFHKLNDHEFIKDHHLIRRDDIYIYMYVWICVWIERGREGRNLVLILSTLISSLIFSVCLCVYLSIPHIISLPKKKTITEANDFTYINPSMVKRKNKKKKKDPSPSFLQPLLLTHSTHLSHLSQTTAAGAASAISFL